VNLCRLLSHAMTLTCDSVTFIGCDVFNLCAKCEWDWSMCGRVIAILKWKT